jgi:hypothetical protein
MAVRRMLLLTCLLGCSKKIEGPAPAVTSAQNEIDQSTAPALLCNAQGDPASGWLIDVLGDNFAPMPAGALSSKATVAMPIVRLDGPEKYTVPDAYVRFAEKKRLPLAMRTAHSTADAHALQPGDYSVTVTNLNGASASAPAAIRVIPPPSETGLAVQPAGGTAGPPRICNDQSQTLIITGTGFRTEAKPAVALFNNGAPVLPVPPSSITVTPAEIDVSIPAGSFSGLSATGTTFTVRIADPNGCVTPYGNAPRGFRVTDVRAYTTCTQLGALTMSQRFGWTQRNQAITITNAFTQPATQPFSGPAPTVTITAPIKGSTTPASIALLRVAYVNANTIIAVVPTCSGAQPTPATDTSAGGCPNGIAPGGPYTIDVEDATGAFGSLSGTSGFQVVASQPPVIASLSPPVIDTTGTADLSITAGASSFALNAKPQIVFPAGGVCDLPINSQSATVIHAQVQGSPCGTALSPGQYVIRVQNTSDNALGDFSSLVVTAPNAPPGNFALVSSALSTARADFPLVQAGDGVGNHYLYALGGITAPVGAAGATVLSTVEMAQIDPFGDVIGDCGGGPCVFRVLDRSPLGEPRRGVAAGSVQIPGDTGYVFVIGGIKSGGAAIATVERAQVLRSVDAPVIAAPVQVVAAGGTLAAGTYYYRVSALLSASDPKNPSGETLASDLEPIFAQNGSRAILSWPCVAGAAKYRVYRTLGPNQGTGTELLLTEQPAAVASCSGSSLPGETFTDDGSATPAGLRPLPPGALGRWAAMPSLGSPRGQAAAALANDRLYVAGGCTGTSCDATGNELATYEDSQLTLQNLGAFSSTGAINQARRQGSFALATNAAAPARIASGEGWLILVGGERNGTVLINSTGGIEVSHAIVGGAAQATPVFANAAYTPDFGRHGGWSEVIANQLVIFGTNPGGAIIFRAGPPCNAPCAAPADFSTDLPQTGTTFTARYLLGEALFRGYFYAAGGFTDATAGATARSTVDRILY